MLENRGIAGVNSPTKRTFGLRSCCGSPASLVDAQPDPTLSDARPKSCAAIPIDDTTLCLLTSQSAASLSYSGMPEGLLDQARLQGVILGLRSLEGRRRQSILLSGVLDGHEGYVEVSSWPDLLMKRFPAMMKRRLFPGDHSYPTIRAHGLMHTQPWWYSTICLPDHICFASISEEQSYFGEESQTHRTDKHLKDDVPCQFVSTDAVLSRPLSVPQRLSSYAFVTRLFISV